LVVVAIIAMLVGLLVPATLRAREAARRGKCSNNQHEMGIAALAYDTTNGHLPGVVNGLGPVTAGTTWQLSWAVVLLPNLGREDAWAGWKAAMTGAATPPLYTGSVPQLVCPSSDPQSTVLSYVGNCGASDSNYHETVNAASTGVILDYYNVPSMPRVSASSIKDGAAQTLMFSENLQAGNWMGGTATVLPTAWGQSSNVLDYLVGMFWSIKTATTSPSSASGINQCLAGPIAQATGYGSGTMPSSNHPGVVLVTYCDGHQEALSQDIVYGVYASLMAPDDATCGITTMTPPP
jgi:hypothetical protein